MLRLAKLDHRDRSWLTATDEAWYYGEYTANGGYQASETNRWISNLKKEPTSPSGELYWKQRAIAYWGDLLRVLLPPNKTAGVVTFVPIPGSKPKGHACYDDRMLKVLQRMAQGRADIDIRQLLVQTAERPTQHHGSRATPDELLETLAVDPSGLALPPKDLIFVVDDVVTMGASFAAAKRRLSGLPGVSRVRGIFLAKTVWPTPTFEDYFG